MEGYQVRIGYQYEEKLRHSFNELAQKTFGINFEEWYQKGCWKEQYVPYSIVIDNKVIANVSISHMDFIWDGSKRHLIQIGTVMTDEDYRGRGYSRILLEQILKEYKEKHGIYLFANNSVLEFYPKFGFQRAKEYQYVKGVEIQQEPTALKYEINGMEGAKQFLNEINKMEDSSYIESKNDELLLFCFLSGMSENIYYISELKTYAIAEIGGSELLLHAVYSDGPVSLEAVFQAFGSGITSVTLGFKPKFEDGFSIEQYHGEDTLFVMGKPWSDWNDHMKMFPTLSHA